MYYKVSTNLNPDCLIEVQKQKVEKVLATINISCPLNICDELRVLELTTLGKGYTQTRRSVVRRI